MKLEGSSVWIALTDFLPLGFLLANWPEWGGGRQQGGSETWCAGSFLTPHAKWLPEACSPVLMATTLLRQPCHTTIQIQETASSFAPWGMRTIVAFSHCQAPGAHHSCCLPSFCHRLISESRRVWVILRNTVAQLWKPNLSISVLGMGLPCELEVSKKSSWVLLYGNI